MIFPPVWVETWNCLASTWLVQTGSLAFLAQAVSSATVIRMQMILFMIHFLSAGKFPG